ncbi:MAG TPA: 2-phosphosulfolactate phosphatase [candidate division Zixibacteria bacterium]|nr:2-phosphosulfolactate phosphatase [candidate division Zixibacteria bacterium]
MRVDVLFTRRDLEAIPRESLAGSTCVVIDVLRASTTLTQAIAVGAEEIHIADSPEEAFAMKQNLGETALLCGERDGLIIPGFDIGNSPMDYTTETVGGRTLIFASTNGSRTLIACRDADEVLIGAFINMPSLIDEIQHAERLLLVGSGKLGRFAIEDAICAGMIFEELVRKGKRPVPQSDSAVCAKWLFERFLASPDDTLAHAEHAQYLCSLGLAEDVAFCTQIGSHRIVPRFQDGIVKP